MNALNSAMTITAFAPSLDPAYVGLPIAVKRLERVWEG